MNAVIRGIAAGVVWGVLGEIFGWLVYGLLFAGYMDSTSSIWRPMESLYWKVGLPLTDIFSGLLAAFAYAILYKGLPGKGATRGLAFGLIFWMVSRLPGELFWYVMIPVPFMLVIAGWIHGLMVAVLGGLSLGVIYGESLEEH